MSSDDPASMQVVTEPARVRSAVVAARCEGLTVGFVPTMGALHEGHLSLVEASLASCDRTVVSIYVNPTQFAPHEDHDHYPRTMEQDCERLRQQGCWVVFNPRDKTMYRPGHQTYVEVGPLAEPFEGTKRPGHFRGVATIVLKLLQIVPADKAFFGRKDYQQLLVVRQMVADFNLPVEVVSCPIVREAGGLAMSSRNAYLSPSERQQATSLWHALQLADELHHDGEASVAKLEDAMRRQLQAGGVAEVDYIAFLEEGTVNPVAKIAGPTVVALAARVGKTRLIDNHTIGESADVARLGDTTTAP